MLPDYAGYATGPDSNSSSLTTSLSCSSSSFHSWLVSQGKTKATIKETVNYAKKYAHVLDTGDASPLLNLSPRNRHHAMTALANLAKFTGRYDEFMKIKQRYSLKWTSGSESILAFDRFFNDNLSVDVMLQRVKEMINKLPRFMGNIIKFACFTGLRAGEVMESVRLINDDNKEVLQTYYYNEERQALEHFKFKQFLRTTKKAYISFVTPEILLLLKFPTTILRCRCRWSQLTPIFV